MFKRLTVVALLIMLAEFLSAQTETSVPQKYALVIGNGAYTSLAHLENPVNDANDMASTLENLGFVVDKVLDGSLEQMEDAVIRLKDRLSVSNNSYGFFFYAGHGVQSGGENYLIPVDVSIPTENFLRSRSVSVQVMLDELNDAGNDLNVVVLDACRDNPFGWNRGGNRGLAMINHQPADSIIVYATSAGSSAFDGSGRNGLFTSQLLKNLQTPGLEVTEVFRLTGMDVAQLSGRQQIPAIYNQFFGKAFLGESPAEQGEEYQPAVYQPAAVHPGPLPLVTGQERDTSNDARLWTVGASVGSSFTAPWFIGTVRGTIAPFNHSFLELGFELGLVSGVAGVGYYSLCPFAHYSYYMPVSKWGGWYAGAGGGYIVGNYNYPEGKVRKNDFVVDAIAGFNILNMIDVSYTFRTNFSGASNKVSVGYVYRF